MHENKCYENTFYICVLYMYNVHTYIHKHYIQREELRLKYYINCTLEL